MANRRIAKNLFIFALGGFAGSFIESAGKDGWDYAKGFFSTPSNAVEPAKPIPWNNTYRSYLNLTTGETCTEEVVMVCRPNGAWRKPDDDESE